MYHNVLEYIVFNQRGKRLAGVVLADCDGPWPHEMRAVERKVLLEALAGPLPEGTIRFKSRVASIKKSETTPGITDIYLQDGSIYSAQVVLGFDGQKSMVASWMGLQPAQRWGKLLSGEWQSFRTTISLTIKCITLLEKEPAQLWSLSMRLKSTGSFSGMIGGKVIVTPRPSRSSRRL